MQPVEIRNNIRVFIVEQLLFGYDDNFGDDASFESEGIIDSTGIFELIAYIEEKYGIKIKDDEVLPKNFDSLKRLTEFVAFKLDGQ